MATAVIVNGPLVTVGSYIVATDGVRNRGWIRAALRKNTPSRAMA